jgi:hypothetical protein
LPKPPVGGGANSLCAIAFMQSKKQKKWARSTIFNSGRQLH